MVYKLFSWLFFKRKTEEKRNTENLKDCATLSLFLTKHLNSQLPLCGFAHYGVLCPCRRFLPEQRQKTLSGPLGSSPVSATKKNALMGVWWRRVQDSNLCTVIHGDGLAIRCITTLPTLH